MLQYDHAELHDLKQDASRTGILLQLIAEEQNDHQKITINNVLSMAETAHKHIENTFNLLLSDDLVKKMSDRDA